MCTLSRKSWIKSKSVISHGMFRRNLPFLIESISKSNASISASLDNSDNSTSTSHAHKGEKGMGERERNEVG